MKKLRNLCAIALTALMVGGTALMSSCESDNRTDFEAMRQQMRSELTEQIRDELQTTLMFDSIGSTPIYISPSVEIGAPRSKVDGFREVNKMIAVFLPFVFVLVLVWMLLNYRRKNLLAKYRLIEYAIEKGNPLPDAFYNNGLVARTSTVMESVARGVRIYRIY